MKMQILSKEEEELFTGWQNTRQLRAKQLSEMARARGRLDLAKHLLDPQGDSLGNSRKVILSAQLKADGLGRFAHFVKSYRFFSRHLVLLHHEIQKFNKEGQ